MKISSIGLNLIRHFEGEKLSSYRCPAGIWTIGIGHTGPDVHANQTITSVQSLALLAADVAKFESALAATVHVPLNQNEYDALVCLMFNIGSGAFSTSTLVKKLNAEDREGAKAQFLVWNKISGKPSAGLTARRAAEAALFVKPVA